MGDDACTIGSHATNKLELDEEVLFVEKKKGETAYATPFLLVKSLTLRVIEDCVTVARTYDQFTELFATYDEVGEEEEDQSEILVKAKRGIGKLSFGGSIGTTAFTPSKKRKSMVDLSKLKALKEVVSPFNSGEDDAWAPVDIEEEEGKERFVREWVKVVSTLKVLLEQVGELTKVVPGLAVRCMEDSESFEKGLVKLNLNVGSHTALQEKLGVSSVWQCLAHHEKVLERVADADNEETKLKKEEIAELMAVRSKLESLGKELRTEMKAVKKQNKEGLEELFESVDQEVVPFVLKGEALYAALSGDVIKDV